MYNIYKARFACVTHIDADVGGISKRHGSRLDQDDADGRHDDDLDVISAHVTHAVEGAQTQPVDSRLVQRRRELQNTIRGIHHRSVSKNKHRAVSFTHLGVQ